MKMDTIWGPQKVISLKKQGKKFQNFFTQIFFQWGDPSIENKIVARKHDLTNFEHESGNLKTFREKILF